MEASISLISLSPSNQQLAERCQIRHGFGEEQRREERGCLALELDLVGEEGGPLVLAPRGRDRVVDQAVEKDRGLIRRIGSPNEREISLTKTR